MLFASCVCMCVRIRVGADHPEPPDRAGASRG